MSRLVFPGRFGGLTRKPGDGKLGELAGLIFEIYVMVYFQSGE